MKKAFGWAWKAGLVLGIIIAWVAIQDRLETKQDLAMPVIASMQPGIPATVLAFEAAEEGGIGHRMAEGTNYLRFILVRRDGSSLAEDALIDPSCAIPPPGARITLEIVQLNTHGTAHGFRADGFSPVLLSVECKEVFR